MWQYMPVTVLGYYTWRFIFDSNNRMLASETTLPPACWSFMLFRARLPRSADWIFKALCHHVSSRLCFDVFRMWPKDTKGRQTEDPPPHFNQHLAGDDFSFSNSRGRLFIKMTHIMQGHIQGPGSFLESPISFWSRLAGKTAGKSTLHHIPANLIASQYYIYTFHIPEQIRLLMWFSEMHGKSPIGPTCKDLAFDIHWQCCDSRTPFGKYTRKMGLQRKHIAKAKSCFELSMQWHPIQFFDRIEI